PADTVAILGFPPIPTIARFSTPAYPATAACTNRNRYGRWEVGSLENPLHPCAATAAGSAASGSTAARSAPTTSASTNYLHVNERSGRRLRPCPVGGKKRKLWGGRCLGVRQDLSRDRCRNLVTNQDSPGSCALLRSRDR